MKVRIDQIVKIEKKKPKKFLFTDTTDQPGAIFSQTNVNVTVDLANKIREDPLFAIRKRETDQKKQLLNNPVKMKQLRELVSYYLIMSTGKKFKPHYHGSWNKVWELWIKKARKKERRIKNVKKGKQKVAILLVVKKVQGKNQSMAKAKKRLQNINTTMILVMQLKKRITKKLEINIIEMGKNMV